MAKASDIVKRWKRNNIHPFEKKGDVEKVINYYNFGIRSGSGSHEIIISHEQLRKLNYQSMGIGNELTLPLKSGKKVRGCYIKDLLKYIELLEKFHGYKEIK